MLLSDTEIQAAVGDKVFPLVSVEDTEGDFIVYMRDKIRQEVAKAGVSDIVATVFLICVSSDYDRSNAIASRCRTLLDGRYSGDIREIRLKDASEDFNERHYMQVLEFEIK